MMGISHKKYGLISGLLFICITATMPVYADAGAPQTPQSEKGNVYDAWYPLLNAHTTITGMIQKPIEASVMYLEDKKVYQKARHIYRKSIEYGFYPVIFDAYNDNVFAEGVTFRDGIYERRAMMPLLGVKYEKPVLDTDTVVGVWGRYDPGAGNSDIGVQFSHPALLDIYGLYGAVTARHQEYQKEEFYGIGRHHSVANDYTFKTQESSIDFVVGKEQILPTVNGELGVGFHKVDIFEGKKKGLHRINAYPSEQGQGIPGLGGADLITYGAALVHDTTDNIKNPTQGARGKVGLTFNHGLNEHYDKFNYMKFRAEYAHYIPMHTYFPQVTGDKVIMLSGAFEKNHDFDGYTIPFFDLARIDESNNRGYADNRYLDKGSLAFTAAYRYTVWKWKDSRADASFFYDCGWSFSKPTKIRFSEAKNSVGVAVRFVMPNSRVIAVGIAKSSENLNFFVTFKPKN